MSIERSPRDALSTLAKREETVHDGDAKMNTALWHDGTGGEVSARTWVGGHRRRERCALAGHGSCRTARAVGGRCSPRRSFHPRRPGPPRAVDMGKRKSSKKAPPKRGPGKVPTIFDCPFCNHEKVVECKLYVAARRLSPSVTPYRCHITVQRS